VLAIACAAAVAGAVAAGRAQPTARPRGVVPPAARGAYRIDAAKSRLIIETETSGLSSMFGHDHKLAAGEMWGTADVAPDNLTAASLEVTVKAASLHVADEKTTGERQAVEAALREDVLETRKYPDITFKTAAVAVASERRSDGTYVVRLTGELALHGVKQRVIIPARVSLQGGTLRAIGLFEIRQTDFQITPFSFVKGTVTIKDTVTISFEIIATRPPP